jgi:biotin carboxyl carrier protein
MTQTYTYQIDETEYTVLVEPDGENFQVTIGDQVYPVAAQLHGEGLLSLVVAGRRHWVHLARQEAQRYVALEGHTWQLTRLTRRQARRGSVRETVEAAPPRLEATMPGQVLAVLVAEGEAVARGQTLLLLEAMKMELRVTAPTDGQVRQVHCVAGQVVERGQVLIELEKESG